LPLTPSSPPYFSGQILPPRSPTIFRKIREYPPFYVSPAVPLDHHYTRDGDMGDGDMDGDRPTSPAGAVGGDRGNGDMDGD